jgi:predicted dehydrogenase
MESQMVGIAVVGAGNWGRNLVRNFASLPGGQLRWVCDLDEKVRKAIAAQYPQAKVTADLAAALADPAVAAFIQGKTVRKVIVAKGKLVSIVIG